MVPLLSRRATDTNQALASSSRQRKVVFLHQAPESDTTPASAE